MQLPFRRAATLSTLSYKNYNTIHFNSHGHRAVHDFCTASDRGLAVIGGVCVPDLVEAKAPLDLARNPFRQDRLLCACGLVTRQASRRADDSGISRDLTNYCMVI